MTIKAHSIEQDIADQQTTCITLPRGTLDLTYQTSSQYALDDLLGFAQRINPKRAFLFVSKVLGRHIPIAPYTMRRAFSDLADLIPENLPEPILVIGMAETAVGLSAGVHQALQTRYPEALLLNSTRHAQPNSQLFATFSEDHSHASSHLIYQSPDKAVQEKLLSSKTLIMVDDEASTGNTCINVVSALRKAGLNQLDKVHLTTLVDWSLGATDSDDQGDQDDHMAKRLQGIAFHRHHLLAGQWQWTDTPNPEPITMPQVDTTDAGSQPLLATGNWGRFPTTDSTQGFTTYLTQFQQAFVTHFSLAHWQDKPLPARILVLGSNEFVWLPFLLAEWLEQYTASKYTQTNTSDQSPNNVVKFSALTRSPIALGGAIGTMVSFQDSYGLGITNFAYNVAPDQWDLIVLCIETPQDSIDNFWQTLDNLIVVSP